VDEWELKVILPKYVQ